MGDLTEHGHGVPVSHPQIGVTVCPPHPQKWGEGGGGTSRSCGGGVQLRARPTSAPCLPRSRSADGYHLAQQHRCGPIGGADAALLWSCHLRLPLRLPPALP